MPLNRSEQMARVRAEDTKPEILLRRALWRAGMRYRKYVGTPVARPDVVFTKERVAVFVDGCFWHGCPDHYVRPRSREEFWRHKLRANVDRDRRQTLVLEGHGWRVLRFWEHEIKSDCSEIVSLVFHARYDQEFCPRLDKRVVLVEGIDDATGLERRHFELLRDATAVSLRDGLRTTTRT